MATLVCLLALAAACVALPVQPTAHNDGQLNTYEEGDKFEGDMILTPVQKRNLRNGLISSSARWPNRIVSYVIDSAFSKEQADHIRDSLEDYNRLTCVTVRPYQSGDKDYVRITGDNSGCWSYVGRIGGEQQLNVAVNEVNVGCLRRGTVIHEMLHALGFYHQQSATERDDYVQIVWDNIIPSTVGNFNKYSASEVTNFGVRYDYGSVMHYGAYAFSTNGEKTIVTLDPNAEIGQRLGFSEKDIQKLNLMYGCSK